MTAEEWRQKVAADRPPLSRAQLAVLRPICHHMTPRIKNTAPACTTGAASQESPMHRNTRGTTA